MADCTQKLQVTVSAAVESWQTGFNSRIVQHVRFNCALAPLSDLAPRCQVSRFQRAHKLQETSLELTVDCYCCLQEVDVRQIYDKFPDHVGGLRDLYSVGPREAFFVVKFWVNMELWIILFCVLSLFVFCENDKAISYVSLTQRFLTFVSHKWHIGSLTFDFEHKVFFAVYPIYGVKFHSKSHKEIITFQHNCTLYLCLSRWSC